MAVGGIMHWPIHFSKIAPDMGTGAGSEDPWFVDRVFRAWGRRSPKKMLCRRAPLYFRQII